MFENHGITDPLGVSKNLLKEPNSTELKKPSLLWLRNGNHPLVFCKTVSLAKTCVIGFP